MVYLKKILVTTDLSEFSLAALEYASSFGLLFVSKIYILYVNDPGASVFVTHGHDATQKDQHPRTEREAQEALEEFVMQNVKPDVNLTRVVRTGVPADEIRKFAEEEGVDMIVLATHGRTGLKHILMGSVAEKTVRLSSIPVLTVKPRPLRENNLKSEDVEKELHLR